MTVHRQENHERVEYDLLDPDGAKVARVTHDTRDRTLPVGVGVITFASGGNEFETVWFTLDQARELLGLLQQVTADVSADLFT